MTLTLNESLEGISEHKSGTCKPVMTYGSLWYDTKQCVMKAFDGNAWVTEYQTNDPWLKQLLNSLNIRNITNAAIS